MENSSANQLPEVDSLPDGFVESSAELLAPQTPTFEQENTSSVDYKNTSLSELDHSSDVDSSLPNEIQSSEKLRTFPVTLTEKDGFLDSVEMVNKGCIETGSRDCEPSNVKESSSHSHGELADTVGSSQGDCQSNSTTSGGCSQLQATNIKEKSTTDSAELVKNKKLETSEPKRKNVKRGFKSEKEFLEFTLKYQQVIAERDSAVAVRDKLESLCRELQRQNKMLMDECKRVSTEGQNMRLDLSTRFHDAIKDVSHKLDEQKDEYLTQLKENEMLRNKLNHLSDQYAVSEQQFTQKLKQKTLELQLADLKLQQHEEKLTQEQSQMKLYAEQVSQLLATEKNLRLQLAADGEKFQQFQDALLKSNEVFETFKQEIEKMAKSIKELKKENIFLKGKCERSDVTLIELVDEREQWKKQLEKMKNQKEKLESLCRSLQAERKQNSAGTNSSDQTLVGSKTSSSETVSGDTSRTSLQSEEL